MPSYYYFTKLNLFISNTNLVIIPQYMLDSINSDPDFMNTIITGDQSWVYGYDREPVIFLTMKIPQEN